MFNKNLVKVINGIDLTENEMRYSMQEIMEGKISDIKISAFLVALRSKGETVDEITGAAKIMREKVKNVNLGDLNTLDTCGTGGDNSGTFNISTTCAFICAANGVYIVKHGNRSISSKSGSADVLENLGFEINKKPDEIKENIKRNQFGFFYAPNFHSAMKYVMPVRKELGIKTIFNILGPLTNPAFAKNQLLGVFDERLTEPMALVLKKLGVKRAMVVHGLDGLDEITVTNLTKISELKDGKVRTYLFNPEKFGIKFSKKNELKGGDAEKNANIIRNILAGDKSAKRDIVLLNSAASLYLAGKVKSIKEGIKLAKEAIDSGSASMKLNKIIEVKNDIR